MNRLSSKFKVQNEKLKIKNFLKPTKGKFFLTLFLLLLIFFGSRLVCEPYPDPYFYMEFSPNFNFSPRLRLCRSLFGINWLVAVVALYLTSSVILMLAKREKV